MASVSEMVRAFELHLQRARAQQNEQATAAVHQAAMEGSHKVIANRHAFKGKNRGSPFLMSANQKKGLAAVPI